MLRVVISIRPSRTLDKNLVLYVGDRPNLSPGAEWEIVVTWESMRMVWVMHGEGSEINVVFDNNYCNDQIVLCHVLLCALLLMQ